MVNAMHGSAVPNLAVAAALGRHETGNQLTTGLQNARDSDGGTLPKARVTKTAATKQPAHAPVVLLPNFCTKPSPMWFSPHHRL